MMTMSDSFSFLYGQQASLVIFPLAIETSIFIKMEDKKITLSDIYTDSNDIDKISVISHANDVLKPMCIFGVLDNEMGMNIRKEMLAWLLPAYNVIEVRQKPPGILYEYPALRFAQWFPMNTEVNFCLYVHTKDA